MNRHQIRGLAEIAAAFVLVFAGIASVGHESHPKKAPAPAPIVANGAGFVVWAEKTLDREHPKASSLDLKAWQREMLPWYVEEGVVDAANVPNPVYRDYVDDSANHILGQCDCKKGLWMNGRFKNPISPWFRDISLVSTMAHELVHAQQGSTCQKADREKVESTAQIVSLEILAAMANNGSRDATFALIEELQSIVLGEMRFQALHHRGAAKRLDSLLSKMDDPQEQAERAQRRRYWEARPYDQEFVLTAYSHKPYELLIKALTDGSLKDLALQPAFSSTGNWEPNPPVIDFDDLSYFVSHMKEIVSK